MYTFEPKYKYARASGRNVRISTKKAEIICKVIRGKPLKRAKRLLMDLESRKRSLKGKYYSKAVKEMRLLLESCEKNAEFAGLDADRLFVHASAHKGTSIRRRRRKAGFGSGMKMTNVEVMLIEKGKAREKTVKKTEEKNEKKEIMKEIEELKKKGNELKEKVEMGAVKK